MERNLVLNIPHSSNQGLFDPEIGKWPHNPHFVNDCVNKWTDWWTDFLFQTDNEKVKSFVFPYSRFVCDAERLEDDPLEGIGQGIIYTKFGGFTRRELSEKNKERLLAVRKDYLNSISNALNEKSVLIDCHSFPSDVSDVDISIGYNNDWSYDTKITDKVIEIFKKQGYKVGENMPYSNSITPNADFTFTSLMIEVNKKVYMNERTLTLERNQRQWMRWFGCLNRVYDTIFNLD